MNGFIKKRSIIMVVTIIFSMFTGCVKSTEIRDVQKTIENQTALKAKSSIENSAIPNFEELYNNTVMINVDFDSEAGGGLIDSVKIEDYKMISDVLTMIGKSQLISDASRIKDMSAAKNNKMIFSLGNGSKKELRFAFDDLHDYGYIEIEGKKYDIDYSFFRYLSDFSVYNHFDTKIDSRVEELFKKYGWTIDYRINSVKKTLPADFKHKAGEYPVKIYWAYNNELSKSIGLDYSQNLGKKVDVEILRLRESLPEYMHPRMNARGIVLKSDDKIIGAYIDSGRHDTFACSLDRKNLKELTDKEWDEWITDYIDYTDKIEIKLSEMKPEEVIKTYYDAINSNNQKMQYACLTRQNLCRYLSANMDDNLLMNTSFSEAFADGAQNIKSAKVIELGEIKGIDNPKGIIEYSATIDFKYRKEITSNNGEQPRFIILKKESDKIGWRIDSVGTG